MRLLLGLQIHKQPAMAVQQRANNGCLFGYAAIASDPSLWLGWQTSQGLEAQNPFLSMSASQALKTACVQCDHPCSADLRNSPNQCGWRALLWKHLI